MTSITSMAQWSTRINQVIFAVLDVSWTMGLNSDKTSKVFCINICCFSTKLYTFCTTVAQSTMFHENCRCFLISAPHETRTFTVRLAVTTKYQGNGFAAEVLLGRDYPRVVPIGPIVRRVIAFPIFGTWWDATTEVASQSVHLQASYGIEYFPTTTVRHFEF